jgi:inner membrane protein
LGACVGEAVAGKQLGKKAMLLGAIAQSLPDIDFLFAFFLDVTENLLSHRGITHSLIFLLLITPIFAWIGYKTWPGKLSWRHWIFFISLEIGIHLLLDSLNNYGMGLLEPFDHMRVALHMIFVADPLFSIWPFLVVIILLIMGRYHRKRKLWAFTGIFLAGFYLVFTCINKMRIESKFTNSLQHQGIAYERKLTTPTPFNNLLWFVTAGGEDGFYVGYRSVFDASDSTELHFFPRNEELLKEVKDREDVRDLIRFSQGFYTVEKWGDTTVFNDLRFGQVAGWVNPEEKFVFHYFLDHPEEENILVVQRGRFDGWNRESVRVLWEKIKE